jgi:hypothetical protein
MALIEHCPNTWHMLIERLINRLLSLGKKGFNINKINLNSPIKSGVQVSISILTYLKVKVNPS